jgi:DNA-binding GntR family transcriptional regulator
MPAIKPVQKRSAESQAAESLRESIVSGAIEPGVRLTEAKLAEQLQLSRATVRTALHQLSQEGLIIQIPYTGWEVMSLEADDAWELYTLRSALEALAARLLAERLTDISRREIEKSFGTLVQACEKPDSRKIAQADFALHKTIIEMSCHRRLIEQYRLVEQQVRIYIMSSDALITDVKQIIAQHRPIIDAIFAGDALNAAYLAAAHNLSEGQVLVKFLKDRSAAA